MGNKKRISPGDKVPLKLTATETETILDKLVCLDQEYEQIIRNTPAGEPVMMTLDDLEDFCGYIAAEANHTDNKTLARKLDRVFDKCEKLLDTYTDEPASALSGEEARSQLLQGVIDMAVGKQPKTVSFRLQSKTPKTAKFPIKVTAHQRASLLQCTDLKAAVRRKIELSDEGVQDFEFTRREIEHIYEEVSQAIVYVRSPHKQRLKAIQNKVFKVIDELQSRDWEFDRPSAVKPSGKATESLIQLRVSLLHTQPEIWRRIQVTDCRLGELHHHIQTAMGWQNCHMHMFIVDGERYGRQDDFDPDIKDEFSLKLSDVLPTKGKRFEFQYVYDFGDDWEHSILFEGYPPIEKKRKYPLCLEGERACPPEDCGGPWGYGEVLEAIGDPDHEYHDEYSGYVDSSFDPGEFSAARATRSMRKGILDDV